MYKHNRGGIGNFFSFAAFMEHFIPYRSLVKKEIIEQLEARKEATDAAKSPEIELVAEKAEEVEWDKAS